MDRSIESVNAGDYTLALSACEAAPGHGMDICRVKEGTKIFSSWVLIVPINSAILGGEVDVYYRDVHKTYPITSNTVSIPWADFFDSDMWSMDFDGEALALVSARYMTPEGIEEVAKFRGIAKLVVTKQGYDRLPIDSGYVGWKTVCKVQYTTAGRGAISCK